MTATARTKRLTPPRLSGWLLVAAAFVGVWFSARQIWILWLTLVVLLPLQLLVCRAILGERGYPRSFAWFALLLGPMGLLIVLGFPVLASSRDGGGRPPSEAD